MGSERIVALALALPLALTGWPAAAAQQGMPGGEPSCLAELEWATQFAAVNYAGFETKTAGERRAEHDRLVATLRERATSATDRAACDAVLSSWTAFFEDGHLSFGRRSPQAEASAGPAPTEAEIRARFADWPTRDVAAARAKLDALGADRRPIEGVWESSDGAYLGVVVRDDGGADSYTMGIVRADSVWWVPGQVKAIFQADGDDGYAVRFFMRDHSEQAWHGRVDRNVLVLQGRSVWFREHPALPGDLGRDEYFASRNTRFAARDVAEGTVLVQIPSFDDAVRMDSLFEAEGDRIAAAERLVIDVRGNGGGSDYNFRALIPLIYTDPIRFISNAALATEANIAANAALAEDPAVPAGIREQLARQVERMKEASGGWYEFPDRVHEEPAVRDRPARVAVLVDGGCASSCEQFLLAARQSRKVTIYGSPTAGILDFGNVRPAPMPGGSLVLYYPTTRSKRLPDAPVDGVGVLPDVAVPAGEANPLAWVIGVVQDS